MLLGGSVKNDEPNDWPFLRRSVQQLNDKSVNPFGPLSQPCDTRFCFVVVAAATLDLSVCWFGCFRIRPPPQKQKIVDYTLFALFARLLERSPQTDSAT